MANFKNIELNSLDKKFFNASMKTEVLSKEERKGLQKIGLSLVIKSPCTK